MTQVWRYRWFEFCYMLACVSAWACATVGWHGGPCCCVLSLYLLWVESLCKDWGFRSGNLHVGAPAWSARGGGQCYARASLAAQQWETSMARSSSPLPGAALRHYTSQDPQPRYSCAGVPLASQRRGCQRNGFSASWGKERGRKWFIDKVFLFNGLRLAAGARFARRSFLKSCSEDRFARRSLLPESSWANPPDEHSLQR